MKLQYVLEAIEVRYNIRRAVLFGACREARIVRPRQIAYYLGHDRIGYGYCKIGYIMKRDHTSVMHGTRKIRDRVQKDSELVREVETVWAIASEIHARATEKGKGSRLLDLAGSAALREDNGPLWANAGQQ